MATLTSEQRKSLERTVIQARDRAEEAVAAAIQALGVGATKAPAHLTDEGQRLRRHLRAHGRQLGDSLHTDGRQPTANLVREGAYEQWHRMLFARFLAENGQLIHPEHGIGVTLAECEELAQEEDCNAWELAGRFASRMLPQIFRPEDPVLQLRLAPEHQQALEAMLASLPSDVFLAEDSLGWVYQFWQARAKDAVNASEVKIGAEELSAVTQLFTEDYMVLFLLHNSLGAWWAGKTLKKDGQERNEDAWRDACRVQDLRFDYLRFLPDGTPAAGSHEGWPKAAKDLTLLDPCMGSGHFLVFAMPILAAFRMEEEGLSEAQAIEAVLRDNLHGLELDPRCTQLAAFNLALAAWKRGGYRTLPALSLACCGVAPQGRRADWVALAEGEPRLEGALDQLYTLFQQAPLLGSLLDPTTLPTGSLLSASLEEAIGMLHKALEGEGEETLDRREAAQAALSLSAAADLLAQRYHLVITNVPYLKRGKQEQSLKDFCGAHYPEAKNDLANVFLERCLELSHPKEQGVVQVVMPQNWLFQTSYKQQRESLLKRVQWNLVAWLGAGAFETISGEVVQAILLTQTHALAMEGFQLRGVDASASKTAKHKAALMRGGEVVAVSQKRQLGNPDARVALAETAESPLLEQLARSYQGIKTGDDDNHRIQFWELAQKDAGWRYMQTTIAESNFFGGLDGLVRWRRNGAELARRQGVAAWGNPGIAISQMGDFPVALYMADAFDSNVSAVVPMTRENITAIWCFCSSADYIEAIRRIDKSLKPTNSSLVKVPFDLAHWQQVANERYPNGLPKPFSNDPTQWLFHGHPQPATDPIQVALARLLGYRWPAETDTAMELSDDARAWIARCPDIEFMVDEDGILPIPAMRGEQPAEGRLRQMLAGSFGPGWSTAKEQELLQAVGYGGKSLEAWLRDGFFEQHCKLFHQRPFIWQIWDGLRDGFSVLVNYHKLDRKGLESLTYSYLGDWITRQKEAATRQESAAQGKVEKALELQRKLVAILEGEAPFDIFVRWKSLAEQPIGWEPDLNDGVRLNIRPFMTAGVLRKDPKIDWKKDRGKDVESAPWFKVFKGERINDFHLSIGEKQKAREKSKLR